MVTVGVFIACILTWSAESRDFTNNQRPTADVLNAVATAMFFGAGVLRYSRWRRTGEAFAARSAAALIVFATVGLPLERASRVLNGGLDPTGWNAVIRMVAALTVAALLSRNLKPDQISDRLRPTRYIAVGATAAGAAFMLLVLARSFWTPEVGDLRKFTIALQLACCLIWLGIAISFAHRGLRLKSATLLLSVVPLTMLAVAGGFRAAADAGSTAWVVGAASLTAIAATLSLFNATRDVHDFINADSRNLLDANRALVDAHLLLQSLEARRLEVEHDAHSMIAALRAASQTLDEFEASLDKATQHQLRQAMDVELCRLGRMLDVDHECTLGEFDLAESLAPIITTQRACGLEVTAEVAGFRAWGRADALAEAVQNLLVNARVHAPGSPVRVRAEYSDQWVRVIVQDRGPGIESGLGKAIFRKRVRGTTTAGGTGLGLAVVRRLMLEQGGDAELNDCSGGGARFVLTLPRVQDDDRAPTFVPWQATRADMQLGPAFN